MRNKGDIENMPTPHINAKDNDFAKVVLMPGDPVRAKWIADTFLHDCKQVTDVRGILGFTGFTKNGKKISVMASGMGMPSIGIYSHELFTHYGVEAIIRVGTCGSYQKNINLKDVLIATASSTDSSWGQQFGLHGTLSMVADFEMAVSAYKHAKEAGIPFHGGNVLAADIFYDYDPNTWKKWADLGVLGVEMEAYALYCNAMRLKKRALCLLTVTDSFVNEGKLTSEERAFGLSRMIELAIQVAEDFTD